KDLKKHELECEFKSVECVGCNKIFPNKNFQEHYEKCLDIIIKCIRCEYKAKRKEFYHQCELKQINTLFNQLPLLNKCNTIVQMLNIIEDECKNINEEHKEETLKIMTGF